MLLVSKIISSICRRCPLTPIPCATDFSAVPRLCRISWHRPLSMGASYALCKLKSQLNHDRPKDFIRYFFSLHIMYLPWTLQICYATSYMGCIKNMKSIVGRRRRKQTLQELLLFLKFLSPCHFVTFLFCFLG